MPPQGKGVNGALARHQIARRNRDVATASDDDNTAMLSKQFQVLAELHVSQHFQHVVDSDPDLVDAGRDAPTHRSQCESV